MSCTLNSIALTDDSRIPNIPFFYLVYRAWSHWRGEFGHPVIGLCLLTVILAWSGSKHLIHLLDLNLINPHAFPELESFYATRFLKNGVPGHQTKDNSNDSTKDINKSTEKEAPTEELLLLEMKDGDELGKILETPAIAIEVERAVLQVGQKLKLDEEKRREKKNQ
jgi:hypothetical protein